MGDPRNREGDSPGARWHRTKDALFEHTSEEWLQATRAKREAGVLEDEDERAALTGYGLLAKVHRHLAFDAHPEDQETADLSLPWMEETARRSKAFVERWTGR